MGNSSEKFFDTFTKVRTYDQHPGTMPRVGVGVIFMSFVFSCFRAFCVFLAFFRLKELIIFMDEGYPPPICGKFPENN